MSRSPLAASRRLRTLAVTAAIAGVALAQQGCANSATEYGPGAPAAATNSTTTPGKSTPGKSTPGRSTPGRSTTDTEGSAAAVFRGERQVFLLPVGSEATLAVGSGGRVGLSDDFGDPALFALTPVAPGSKKFLIQTAKLRKGGEAYCLTVQKNGRKPMSVATTACDTRVAAQIFVFGDAGKNGEGKATYAIGTGASTYFVLDPQGKIDPDGGGLVAQDIGVEKLDTTFILVDQGKAGMPNFD
jgi:hypothetical protein